MLFRLGALLNLSLWVVSSVWKCRFSDSWRMQSAAVVKEPQLAQKNPKKMIEGPSNICIEGRHWKSYKRLVEIRCCGGGALITDFLYKGRFCDTFPYIRLPYGAASIRRCFFRRRTNDEEFVLTISEEEFVLSEEEFVLSKEEFVLFCKSFTTLLWRSPMTST